MSMIGTTGKGNGNESYTGEMGRLQRFSDVDAVGIVSAVCLPTFLPSRQNPCLNPNATVPEAARNDPLATSDFRRRFSVGLRYCPQFTGS